MQDVIIYTKDYCPYCVRAKNYFDERSIAYEEKDVTHDPDLLQEMLARSNGRRTVPEIFIGDVHVGGWDDLNILIQSGKLDSLLE